MHRSLLNVALALALIATGWIIAQAQTPDPDFEIVVDAPSGSTTVTCVRGCTLAWVERGVNPNARPTETFEYACTGPRCSSARIGGWVTR